MPLDLIRFNSLAGAEIRYARFDPPSPHVYGTRGAGPRTQRLTLEFLAKLERALGEVFQLHPWGPAEVVVSGGAAVPESPRRGPTDKHVLGRAYDLDALWWGGELNLITLQAPHQWAHYLAIESILRRHLGTVLGHAYNRAHRDHWHLDDGSPVRWDPRSKSRVLAVQGALAHIWDRPVEIDGAFGPQTRAAFVVQLRELELGPLAEAAWADEVRIELWREWLLLTARRGFERV